MTTNRTVIPTHRWLRSRAISMAGTAMVLGAVAAAYVLAVAPETEATLHAQALELLAQQREQGHAEGFAEAMDQMSATVADAYTLGWRAASASACKPIAGAPL
jgi:hypothetical protein